jgi:hypothetical protein
MIISIKVHDIIAPSHHNVSKKRACEKRTSSDVRLDAQSKGSFLFSNRCKACPELRWEQ